MRFIVLADEGGSDDFIALDEDELAFADVLRGDFGQFAPADDLEPAGAFLGVAVFVGPAAIGGEGEVGDGDASRRVAHFCVAPDVSDQDGLLVHGENLLCVMWSQASQGFALLTGLLTDVGSYRAADRALWVGVLLGWPFKGWPDCTCRLPGCGRCSRRRVLDARLDFR